MLYKKMPRPTVQEYIKTVQRRLDDLALTPWCTQALKTIQRRSQERKIESIRCLALDSPSESQNAQYQLAFLIMLAKALEIEDVTLWDPKFEKIDSGILENYGFTISESANHSETTLYFVPHGPRSLNVQLAGHASLIYLGNDFRNFVPPPEVSSDDLEALQHLGKHHVVSLPVPRHEKCFLAMNHLALHII